MTTDPDLLRDLIEERAAIIQEGEGCSRAQAEDRAARCHGFSSWADYVKRGGAAGQRGREGAKG